MTRSCECTPTTPGSPTTSTRSAAPSAWRGQQVAVLDVGRAALVVALDVGVDVGHHLPVGAAQAVERGPQRTGAQRRPVAVPPQAQQQVVAPVVHREAQAPHLLGRQHGAPVGLDQLEHARHHVAGVVQQGLVGVERQVGQQDEAPVAGIGRQPAASAIASVERPAPPAPVTATSRPRQAPGPGRRPDGLGGRHLLVAAADRAGHGPQGVEQLLGPEARRQHGVHAEVGPRTGGAPSSAATTTHPWGAASSTRSRSRAASPASTSSAENGRPDRRRARASSSDTTLTKSTGRVAEVAQRATSPNQGAHAGQPQHDVAIGRHQRPPSPEAESSTGSGRSAGTGAARGGRRRPPGARAAGPGRRGLAGRAGPRRGRVARRGWCAPG